jgi:hypothetical protein
MKDVKIKSPNNNISNKIDENVSKIGQTLSNSNNNNDDGLKEFQSRRKGNASNALKIKNSNNNPTSNISLSPYLVKGDVVNTENNQVYKSDSDKFKKFELEESNKKLELENFPDDNKIKNLNFIQKNLHLIQLLKKIMIWILRTIMFI